MAYRHCGNLLEFKNLRNQKHVAAIYAVGWRIMDAPDEWTDRFSAFKVGERQGVRGACTVVPQIIKAHRLEAKNIVLVSAISSDETSLNNKASLFKLGHALGKTLGWLWCPSILEKKKHSPLHKMGGEPGEKATRRDSEIRGKYTAGPIPEKCDAVVILDDLCTRGSTITEISRAIIAQKKGLKMWGLVLAKNDRKHYMASCGHDIGNGHIPNKYARLWDQS